MALDLKSDAVALSNPANQLPRGILADLLARILGRADAGEITVELPGGQIVSFKGSQPGPTAHIALKRWRALRRFLFGGQIGFAEAYMDGDCDCQDLKALLAWAIANEKALSGAAPGFAGQRLMTQLRHWFRRNSRAGSKRNISAHYDLGNEFYQAWLDKSMQYSSAVFSSPNQTLEAAQDAKLEQIVQLLDIKGGERILEIGFGWGALSERLAVRHGCDVTAITLSREQLNFSRDRLNRAGAGSRAALELQDYRDVQGTFDRIVSIEMIEAVGEQYWPVYFNKLRQSLSAGGIAVLQAITIDPGIFDSYRANPDFIQRYIFPGGMLPTPALMRWHGAAVGLELSSVTRFAESYAQTLAIWRQRFETAWPELTKLGFDERFRRMWTYYLCYCEIGFLSGQLDVGHYRFVPGRS